MEFLLQFNIIIIAAIMCFLKQINSTEIKCHQTTVKVDSMNVKIVLCITRKNFAFQFELSKKYFCNNFIIMNYCFMSVEVMIRSQILLAFIKDQYIKVFCNLKLCSMKYSQLISFYIHIYVENSNIMICLY